MFFFSYLVFRIYSASLNCLTPSTTTPTPIPPHPSSVAIGSSTQIALFVAPFCVIVGWIIGQPLSFNFQMFETATVFITVLMINFIIIDGRSNWMIGMLLIAGYIVIAMSFAMHAGTATG